MRKLHKLDVSCRVNNNQRNVQETIKADFGQFIKTIFWFRRLTWLLEIDENRWDIDL